MITATMIARINELARKQREGILTESEKEEQAKLRRLYIDNIKDQIKLQFGETPKENHHHDCNCGCHHHQH
jgi:uncharacterized protein YnzC (UPF0291/DUF896 family)